MTASPSPRRRRILIPILVLLCIVGAGIGFFVVQANRQTASAGDAPGLVGAVCTGTSAPATVMSPEGIGADFPCMPLRVADSTSTMIGTVHPWHYIADVGHTRYDIMYADYGELFSGELTGLLQSIVQDRAKDATLEEFSVKEDSSEKAALDGREGLLIKGSKDGHAARIILYLVGKKLFRIAVAGPTSDIDSPQNLAFLNSLKINVSS